MATVTVRINGLEYNLKGREDVEYLKKVANYVETKIQEMVGKNNKLTAPAVSALAAINIADELFKGNREYNSLLDEYERIQEENKKLRKELSSLKEDFVKVSEEKQRIEMKDIDKLDNEILSLKELVSIKEIEVEELNKKNEKLLNYNKEIKFELQSSKYKLMDLEKKFLDSQITIATEKKNKNVLLNIKRL